jgi:hypothetical protein
LEFENIVGDSYRTTWHEVLNGHFPEPLEETTSAYSCDKKEDFKQAIELFNTKILNNKKPRDLQYIYMTPGGDYHLATGLLTSPRMHLHCFKEMLCIAKLLPVGDIPKPSNELALQWYYMSYHKSNREKFVLSGKKLDNKTIESVTAFFGLSSSRKSLMVRSNAKRRIVSASLSFAKLRRSSTDGSARPPMAGVAIAPDTRLLFMTIDTATTLTVKIGAIAVIVSTMIAVMTAAAPPTER